MLPSLLFRLWRSRAFLSVETLCLCHWASWLSGRFRFRGCSIAFPQFAQWLPDAKFSPPSCYTSNVQTICFGRHFQSYPSQHEVIHHVKPIRIWRAMNYPSWITGMYQSYISGGGWCSDCICPWCVVRVEHLWKALASPFRLGDEIILTLVSRLIFFRGFVFSSQITSFGGYTVYYLKCPIVVFDTRSVLLSTYRTMSSSSAKCVCLLTGHDPRHLKTIIWVDYVRNCKARFKQLMGSYMSPWHIGCI